MCDKRDSRKKRFIEALTAEGTISCASRAAGVFRWTAYRWRGRDREFREAWDHALEVAIDAVESVLYQQALAGDVLAAIAHLRANRPGKYREIRVTKADLEIPRDNVQAAIPSG